MLDHFTISCLLVGTHICSIKILRLHEKIFYGKHLLRAHRAYNGWKDEEGERGGAEVSIKQAERAEWSPSDDVLMIFTVPGGKLEGSTKVQYQICSLLAHKIVLKTSRRILL